MKIEIVRPASFSALTGNRITARRYGRLISRLGHRVVVHDSYGGGDSDILIALHARHSLDSVRRFHERHPARPLILVLTGTDLYRDIHERREAQSALEMASRLVVLQKMGLKEIPRRFRPKTRVIYQSAEKIRKRVQPSPAEFRVCSIANLRPEKDPFRVARAVARLPAWSKVNVVHIGAVLRQSMRDSALSHTARNRRYRWIGEQPHWKTRRILAASHLLVITSRMEGSSNSLCEALVSSVPVIASRIPGLVGTLGSRYTGYFKVGDTAALTRLLVRTESEPEFYAGLKEQCERVAPLVSTEHELASWKDLLTKL